MNKNNSIIYGACCRRTKQWYLGQTRQGLTVRIKQHKYYASNNHPGLFYEALRIEGFESFDWVELCICTQYTVFEIEKKLIKDFSAKSIKILNKIHAPKKNNSTGPSLKIKTLFKKLKAEASWKQNRFRKFQQLAGKLKPVINLKTLEKFESISDAERKSNYSKKAIKISCIYGEIITDDNIYAFLDTNGAPITNPKEKKSRNIRVKKMDSGIIYKSAIDASNATDASPKSIQACCTGAQKTAGGSIFCYVDINNEEILTEKHIQYQKEMERKKDLIFAVWRIEDTERKYILFFKSIAELKKKINISSTHITSIAEGKRQHTHGWHVAYYNKLTNNLDLKEKHQNKVARQIRKVICLNDDLIYSSIKQTAKYYGLSGSQIRLCCEGELKTTGGKSDHEMRRRFAYIDQNGIAILTAKHKEPLEWRGKIQLFCPNNLKLFQSIANASRELDIPQKTIYRYLKNSSVDLGGVQLINVSQTPPPSSLKIDFTR